ncbi:hypothetical protein BsWGS_19009 [Bradybaena similaris]
MDLIVPCRVKVFKEWCGVFADYKQHHHGDHYSDEGDGLAGECHPGLHSQAGLDWLWLESATLVCILKQVQTGCGWRVPPWFAFSSRFRLVVAGECHPGLHSQAGLDWLWLESATLVCILKQV